MDALNINKSGQIGQGLAQVMGDRTGEAHRAVTGRAVQQGMDEIKRLKDQESDTYKSMAIQLDGMEKDVNGELLERKNELRGFTASQFAEKGINNETMLDVEEKKAELQRRIAMSKQQKDFARAASRELQKPTASKYWDAEESAKQIEKFKNLDIDGRAEFNERLLIEKTDEYNPYDIPDTLISKYGNPALKPDQFTERITKDPGVQTWYARGLEDGSFVDAETAYSLYKEQHMLQNNRPRRPGAGSKEPVKKEDGYGEVNLPRYAQNHIFRDADGKPTVESRMIGGEKRDVTSVAYIRGTKQENYGVVNFIDPSGQNHTDNLGKVSAMNYLHDPIAKTSYLVAERSIKKRTEPSEIPQYEVDAAMMLPKYGKYLMSENPDAAIREALSAESEKTVKEVVSIPLQDPTVQAAQAKFRPNLWQAHLDGIKQFELNELPIPDQAQEWLDSYGVEPNEDPDLDQKILNDYTR